MNNLSRGNVPIRSELLASKLNRLKNFENEQVLREIEERPRLVEMLLFLQWISNPENYAGGIPRFASDLVKESAHLFGTAAMLEIGNRKALTREQTDRIINSLPERLRGEWPQLEDSAARWITSHEKAPAEKTYDHFFNLALTELDLLIQYLFRVCEETNVSFSDFGCDYSKHCFGLVGPPWFFPNVCRAILEFMDRRKARVADRIAETQITREITRWLEIARKSKRCVLITGSERFGKTEAVKNWCAQNPGRARFVATPTSNAERDLLAEVARALGLDTHGTTTGELRAEIAFILEHSGLMLVFDECQFLLPGNYSKTTAPKRLNWFRREVMDRGVAAALVATPQSYKSGKDRFVKKTGFAIAQFDERILKTVPLPNEIPREDLLAIAAKHFPGLHGDYLQLVVERTIATERNYVSDIEKIATLARLNAEAGNRQKPNLDDVKSAMADVLPTVAATPEPVPASPRIRKNRVQSIPQLRFSNSTEKETEFPCREITLAAQNRLELHPELTG